MTILTLRGKQVLSLASEGLTYKEIGGRLGISDSTVKVHMKLAYAKLDARSAAHAVAIAIRGGHIT